MKIDRTKYTAHYENGVVVAQWVSVEMALDTANGESPLEALDRSQELVQQWYKSKNLPFETNSVPPGPPPVITIERTSEDKRIADLVRDMYACTQLGGDDGLGTYWTVAQLHTETKLAYDVMKKKLVKIESDELLSKSKQDNGPIK
jgi:hypothetical protein